MAENKIPLETYVAWLLGDGLTVDATKPSNARAWPLDFAIKEYGLDAIKAALLPVLSELIKTTRDVGVRTWNGASNLEKERAAAYQAFLDTYKRGEVVEIESGLEVQLRNGKAMFVK